MRFFPAFALFCTLLAPLSAFAFPEMIRHGYVNCSTCHVSPSGGGLLSEYGRALSKEALSRGRWFFESVAQGKSADTEEAFLGGTVAAPKWLNLGGSVRMLQAVRETPREIAGRFILMQADLEFGVSDGKRFSLVGTLGRGEPARSNARVFSALNFLVSRRHWLGVLMGPDSAKDRLQLRAGRFFPAYGLNIAEHVAATRKLLGFDQEQESYNLEFSYLGEEWSGAATAIVGRPDLSVSGAGEGLAFQIARGFGKHKAGVNAMIATRDTGVPTDRSWMTGAFATLGFTPKLYALAELDLLKRNDGNLGYVHYAKLGWEFVSGVHLLALQDYGKPSLGSSDRFQESYGTGLQYFPRPHWDLLVTARKERNTAASRDFGNGYWLSLNLYL